MPARVRWTLNNLNASIPTLRGVLYLALAFYISGRLGLLLAIPPGYATAIWPPSGIALAGLLIGGYRLWPGIALGSFCISVTWYDPSSGWALSRFLILGSSIAAGATLQALAGAFLRERFIGRPLELIRARQVATFFLLTGALSCLINASIGVAILTFLGSLTPAQALQSWWTWWIGDSIGIAVVSPLLFVWWAEPRGVWHRRRYSVAVPLVCVLLLSVALFGWVSRIEDARIRVEFAKDVAEATRVGAIVTGVDIAPNLLEQGRARAASEWLMVQFDEGDAEQLPYPDAAFDVVVSMFGVMFAPRPELAAAELVRVCRSGGRIALANWTPAGFAGQVFKTVGKHVPPPPHIPPPAQWGDEVIVRERLRDGIADLQMTKRICPIKYQFPPSEVVEFFRMYFGPVNQAFAALDANGQAALRRDLEQLWSAHNRAEDNSTYIEAEYLEVIATRS